MRRIQLRLSGAGESMLGNMEDRLGAKAKDVITDALAFYDWATESVEHGYKVGRFSTDNEQFESMTTQTLRALAARISEKTAQGVGH